MLSSHKLPLFYFSVYLISVLIVWEGLLFRTSSTQSKIHEPIWIYAEFKCLIGKHFAIGIIGCAEQLVKEKWLLVLFNTDNINLGNGISINYCHLLKKQKTNLTFIRSISPLGKNRSRPTSFLNKKATILANKITFLKWLLYKWKI